MNKRVNVLGVGISVTNMKDTLASIQRWVSNNEKKYICVSAVHSIMEAYKDTHLQQIHNQSGLTVPDGRPLYWLGRMGGHSQMGPVPGEQLSLHVCEMAAREGLTLFLYGGADEVVAQELTESLTQKYPGLQIVGTYTPPFRPLNAAEESELIAQVEEAKPDIFWVGLGSPKQELFMGEYLPKLNTKVMIGLGAVFDYHTGRIPRTPEFLRTLGLAWFYRLCSQPRRLLGRYAYYNPRFVAHVTAQKLGIRNYPLND